MPPTTVRSGSLASALGDNEESEKDAQELGPTGNVSKLKPFITDQNVFATDENVSPGVLRIRPRR